MKKFIFPTLIALSALSVSASAAFYSITGLSKLFVGAEYAVIIMASALEVAKLVIASYLYQFWKKTNALLKTYLVLALGVLILITSAGIYGFLSSAYEQTASKNTVIEKQIAALDTKRMRFIDTKVSYDVEKKETAKNTSELRQALSTGTLTQYKDKETGQILNVANTGNRKAFEKQLENTLKKDSILDYKINAINDSVASIESKILDQQSKAEIAGELGPLKYISKLLNTPMDKIINWFILVIILVFDPLAISLVIAANNAFNNISHSEPLSIHNEKLIVEKPTHLDPNNPPPIAPATPPPPYSSFMSHIFKRKKDDEDVKTY